MVCRREGGGMAEHAQLLYDMNVATARRDETESKPNGVRQDACV